MGLFKSVLKAIFGKPSSINNPQSSQFEISSGNPEKAWMENQDVTDGLIFKATMQLRTPLRVLKRHGEIHSDINTKCPDIVKRGVVGVWGVYTPQPREFRRKK